MKARACIHNTGCICSESRCSIKCGWNPRGAKARQDEIRANGLKKCKDGNSRLIVKSKTQNKDAEVEQK